MGEGKKEEDGEEDLGFGRSKDTGVSLLIWLALHSQEDFE
jgi:hypothetical protein